MRQCRSPVRGDAHLGASGLPSLPGPTGSNPTVRQPHRGVAVPPQLPSGPRSGELEGESGEEGGRRGTSGEGYLGTRQLDLQNPWYERRADVGSSTASSVSSTDSYALLQLVQSVVNYLAGRSRAPQFTSKGCSESLTLVGGPTRLTGSHHVRLSRVGEVTTHESMCKLCRHLESPVHGSCRSRSSSLGGVVSSFHGRLRRSIAGLRDPRYQ